jgi:hypothetical protein
MNAIMREMLFAVFHVDQLHSVYRDYCLLGPLHWGQMLP